AGSDSEFDISFDPGTLGPRTATVRIATNDPAQPTFNFRVRGDSVPPVISVEGNGVPIDDGDASPHKGDYTHFGFVDVAASPLAHRFSIFNRGQGTLHITGVTIDQVGSNFSVTPATNSTVVPGGQPATI